MSRAANRIDQISKRQKEVLLMVTGGATNSKVASDLEIAEATVEGHIREIKLRLGVDSRCALSVVGYIGLVAHQKTDTPWISIAGD